MSTVYRLEFWNEGIVVKEASATGSVENAKLAAEQQFDTETMECVRVLDESGVIEFAAGRRDDSELPMQW
jgi:hypothetical protein